MGDLKDDCFAMGSELMPYGEAMDILRKRIAPVAEAETVPLRAALGRIAAEDVVASRNVPPHDNAAVDGYAVYFEDLNDKAETRLPVTGRIAAGHPLDRPAGRGEALRVFTGAPMPAGPDTIFFQEDCERDGDTVILKPGIKKGANRRSAGEDIAANSVIIGKGRRLRAQEIGLAASVGSTELPVYRRLRAAVFSTGDEVRDPSGDAPPGCIFDANRYTVACLLEGMGLSVTDLGILPDSRDAIRDALRAAARDHDILITSGGASQGEEDHIGAAVQDLGALHFWRLAIKPGRPIALGRVAGKAFVGLPGNPVAVMVTFMQVARPLILMLTGCADIVPPTFKVRAEFDHKKKLGRREWLRAKLMRGEDGVLGALKYHTDGAGILSSMAFADGLIELPEDQGAFEKGFWVDFLPFSEVMR
ncbi:MAG: molybdopterin molybdotransferase MoeA [Rhodospirillales bacterium]